MEPQNTLSSAERQENILLLLAQRQRVTIEQICQAYKVSAATARRDLETLASRGRLQRFHGGAFALKQAPPELPILQRSSDQVEEKCSIARSAAALIQEGETVFLGSGSTVLQLAQELRRFSRLTVITNSLAVINALSAAPGISLVSLGGVFRPSELSFIGHITEQALAEVHADHVFIGIRAIDSDLGLFNDHLPETMTDRAILKAGQTVVVLADHTKLGRVSTAFVAPLNAIDVVVTGRIAPPAFVQTVTDLGIQVIIAD